MQAELGEKRKNKHFGIKKAGQKKILLSGFLKIRSIYGGKVNKGDQEAKQEGRHEHSYGDHQFKPNGFDSLDNKQIGHAHYTADTAADRTPDNRYDAAKRCAVSPNHNKDKGQDG